MRVTVIIAKPWRSNFLWYCAALHRANGSKTLRNNEREGRCFSDKFRRRLYRLFSPRLIGSLIGSLLARVSAVNGESLNSILLVCYQVMESEWFLSSLGGEKSGRLNVLSVLRL